MPASAGGLEGRSPSKNRSLWAAHSGFSAVSSPQTEILGCKATQKREPARVAGPRAPNAGVALEFDK